MLAAGHAYISVRKRRLSSDKDKKKVQGTRCKAKGIRCKAHGDKTTGDGETKSDLRYNEARLYKEEE